MATKKKKQDDPPVDQKEIIQRIIREYEHNNVELMGHLHNRFVGFISESKLPLPQVITVLQILLNEALQLATAKYLGDS